MGAGSDNRQAVLVIVAREVNDEGYTPLEAQLLAERERCVAEIAKVVALLEAAKKGELFVRKPKT